MPITTASAGSVNTLAEEGETSMKRELQGVQSHRNKPATRTLPRQDRSAMPERISDESGGASCESNVAAAQGYRYGLPARHKHSLLARRYTAVRQKVRSDRPPMNRVAQ